jgi:hypothetical protein
MIKNSSKQTGSVFIVVIVIVVIAIIAGLGFIFWNQQNKAATEKTPVTTKSTNKDLSKTESPAQRLILSDWSIEFTVPVNLKLGDIYYYKTHIAEGPEYYGFTTNRVRAQGDACNNQVTGNLVTLNRSTTKSGAGTLLNNAAIGGYFYYAGSSVGDITPTPACLLTDEAVQDRALLNELVKSVATQ